MSIDIGQCVIRPPVGEEVRRLYEILWEIFVADRPVYERLLAGTLDLSDGRWFTMFSGETIVGNACLTPVSIWLGGRPVEILGVGAVATAPAFRRMGVARRLMEQVTAQVDRAGRASALFTTLPQVYAPFGYRTVNQEYRSFPRAGAAFADGGLEGTVVKRLDEPVFSRIKNIYTNRYPNYDGKVVRTQRYWSFYRVMFDCYDQPHVILGYQGNECVGYVRVEKEEDRVLISELCGAPETAEGLLRLTSDSAAERGLGLMSLALPAGHFAWAVLRDKGVEVVPEVGGDRETFMVRGMAGEEVKGLERLQWSLADKF